MIWHKKLKKPLTTVDERLSKLSDDYEKARFELSKYYMEAFIDGDVSTQKEIKAELDNLKAQFDESLISLVSGVE